jgi:hypothetical protein
MLDSFVRHTRHPEKCEVLVKVDQDDDLEYFKRLHSSFPTLNLRFFPTPRGNPFSLHRYHSFLIDHASPTSKAWFTGSDDGVFVREGWDLDVYALIDREPVFVAGSKPLSSQIGLIGPIITNPKPVYGYGAEAFPVVAFNLLRALDDASKDLEGWTTLGDAPWVDAYIAGLVHLLIEKHGVNIYHQIDRYCAQAPRKVSWTRNPKKVAVFVETMDKFFSSSAVAARTQVVDRLCRSGLFGPHTGAAV